MGHQAPALCEGVSSRPAHEAPLQPGAEVRGIEGNLLAEDVDCIDEPFSVQCRQPGPCDRVDIFIRPA